MDFLIDPDTEAIAEAVLRFVEREVLPLEERHRDLLGSERTLFEANGRVRARTGEGDPFEANAPVTLDCTGRDALYQRKHGTRKRDPMLNKVSIWTLYQDAKRDPGLDEGATTIAYLPGGE